MSTSFLNNPRLRKSVILQVLFIVAIGIVVPPQHYIAPFSRFLFYKSLSLTLILVPVYFNFFVLVPFYFKSNKRLYAILLLSVLVLFTMISYLCFKWVKMDYVPFYLQENPLLFLLIMFISLSMITGTQMFFKLLQWYQEQFHLKELKLESELHILKLQMSPHFFFNILNSIYHSIKIDPLQAETIVYQLSEIMQYHIYDCRRDKVELEREVKNIHNYIGLQQMRLAYQPAINVDVKGELSNKFIAPFILINFVENAFKHGLEKQSKEANLRIRLDVQDEILDFRISNSKSTFNIAGDREAGTGLMNVKQRLELLYPSRHTFHMEDKGHEYSIVLQIHLN